MAHLCPHPPQPRERPKSLRTPLLPASTFRSIKRRAGAAQSPQVCEGPGGVKKGVGRLKDTGRLNPNHCSGLGNRASTPRWKGFWKGDLPVPQPQSSGWKRVERGSRVSIIIFIFYFWNLAVPGSREGMIQWGKASDKAS